MATKTYPTSLFKPFNLTAKIKAHPSKNSRYVRKGYSGKYVYSVSVIDGKQIKMYFPRSVVTPAELDALGTALEKEDPDYKIYGRSGNSEWSDRKGIDRIKRPETYSVHGTFVHQLTKEELKAISDYEEAETAKKAAEKAKVAAEKKKAAEERRKAVKAQKEAEHKRAVAEAKKSARVMRDALKQLDGDEDELAQALRILKKNNLKVVVVKEDG